MSQKLHKCNLFFFSGKIMDPASFLEMIFFWKQLVYHQFKLFLCISINTFVPVIDVDNNIYF